MARLYGGLLIALLLAGCQTRPPAPVDAPSTAPAAGAGWREEALPEHASRIERISEAWSRALGNARRAGFVRQIAAEGRLLDPAAGLPFPAPSPGSYMCRTIRFAPPRGKSRAFAAYRPFFCFVGAGEERLFLTKQTGSDRPSGYLWDSGSGRALVFLGSVPRGDAAEAGAYGQDEERDVVGLLERIGPLRFRLVIPRDVERGAIDVLELVPAPVQNEN
ncbi:MAG TPA: DUF4893 domain-containing protein [Allosphingosinicella sp.]|nr:DUF4893 domain-containing protein [Allosphingosinicella sp.]